MIPLIAAPDWSDNATITSSGNTDSTGPATNLQAMQPKRIWKTATDGASHVVFDRGSTQPLNFWAVLFHNLTSTGTLRFRVASTEANLTSAPLYDSGSDPMFPGYDTWARKHYYELLSSSVSARWARLDITDTSNPNGFMTVGRFYISNAWVSPYHAELGTQHGIVSYGVTQRSAIDGTLHARQVAQALHTQFTLTHLPEAEIYTLFNLLRTRGTSRDFVIHHDIRSLTYRVEKLNYGRLTQVFPHTEVQYQRASQRFEVEELI